MVSLWYLKLHPLTRTRPGHICWNAVDSSRLLAAVLVVGTKGLAVLQLWDRKVVIPHHQRRGLKCSLRNPFCTGHKNLGTDVHRHTAASAQEMREGTLQNFQLFALGIWVVLGHPLVRNKNRRLIRTVVDLKQLPARLPGPNCLVDQIPFPCTRASHSREKRVEARVYPKPLSSHFWQM